MVHPRRDGSATDGSAPGHLGGMIHAARPAALISLLLGPAACGGATAATPGSDASTPDARVVFDAASHMDTSAPEDAGLTVDDAGLASDGGAAGCGTLELPGLYPDGAPPWRDCHCPDAGCPSGSVCAWYIIPEGPREPLGCAPLSPTCPDASPCECAAGACGVDTCFDVEAGVLCN